MKSIKTIARNIFTLLLIVATLLGGFCVFLWFAMDSFCQSEIFQEVYSPNGKNKVVVFQRDCGATTGFRTHISVFKSKTVLKNQTGNIFQADGYPDWFNIKVFWKDDQHVIIEDNGKPIPGFLNNKVGKIDVQFVENTEGILPPRSFMPDELLLPDSYFPKGWTGKELRPMGREEIKGSHENNPYMLYTPPPPAEYPEAGLYVSRLDNVDKAVKEFRQELSAFKEKHTDRCFPSYLPDPETPNFKSEYSENVAIGYALHPSEDESQEPECMLIGQYDEFFIMFRATISDNGLTHEQFNELAEIVDQIMVQHLRK